MDTNKRTALAAVVTVALWAGTLSARQPGAGTLQGTVTLAENGDGVHGAVVLVVDTGDVALTDEAGRFAIAGVPAGSHDVLAQREHLSAGRQTVAVTAGTVATADFVLELSPVHEDVTVTATATGRSTALEAFNATTTLDSFDLVTDAHATLGEALQHEPGVANRSFGAGASRPIIRGFDGDRVLVVEDGIRTGDLGSQSGDHGVTIDPNSLERVEVVRGPATLLYGSNAVGGVVNAITPHEAYRDALDGTTRGQFSADAGSANAQAGTNGSVQHAHGHVLVWGGGGVRRTGDYHSPDGAVDNSASELTTGRAGAGYTGDRFYASGGVTLEDGRYGVPFAGELHHHENGDDATAAEHVEVDLTSSRRAGRFDIGMRRLDHPVVAAFRLALNAIDWDHDELEIDDGVESVGTRFSNRTYIVRAEVDQRQTARLSGKFGVWTQVRDYLAEGAEALAPPTDQTSLAAFAYEELSVGRLRIQLGGRVERTGYAAAARGDGHGAEAEEHEPGHDEGPEHDHDGLEPPDPRDRRFTGASVSAGVLADLGRSSSVVVNLTRSYRAPALEELYNFGPHVGNLAFEVGNPDLDAETTVGLDLSLRHQSDRVRGHVNFYVYDIDDFIFASRTDEILDGLLIADFVQGDSRFVGFDATGSVRVVDRLWANLGLGLVDAELTATGEALPRIPPFKGRLSLDLPYGGLTVSPELILAAGQDQVFRDETRTDGYALVNLKASYVWPRRHLVHTISVLGYNLTNERYRNHTSFIKDLAPEMGRGVKVGYSVRFF